jgi:hypothetical protein
MKKRLFTVLSLAAILALLVPGGSPPIAAQGEDDQPFFVAIGNGKMYAFPISGEPHQGYSIGDGGTAAVADFDNDELCEVLAVKGSDRLLRLYESDGGTGFVETVVSHDAYPPDNFSIIYDDSAVGDFDDNGYMDFAFTGARCASGYCPPGGQGLIQLHMNLGGGHFERRSIDVSDFRGRPYEAMRGLDDGDFNEDGYQDLAAQQYWNGSNNVTHLFFGNGDGTFVDSPSFFPNSNPDGTPALVSGDFNNDGHLDLIIGQDDGGDPGQTWLYVGDGNGAFTRSGPAYDTNQSVESGGNGAGAGKPDAYDFDSDGNLDVIAPAAGNEGVDAIGLLLFKGNGDGTFQRSILINDNANWSKAAAPPETEPPCRWGGFDFQVEDIWASPSPTEAMSESTISVVIRNAGSTAYVPTGDEYTLGVKLTDTDTEPDKYWYYRFRGSGIGALPPDGLQTLQITNFLFTRPQVDQIEVTFFPTDSDRNTTNNVRTETITIQPPSESWLDCVSMLLDVVMIYLDVHAVDIDAVKEISADLILTNGKIIEAVSNADYGQVWSEGKRFLVNSAITIAAYTIFKPARVAISLIKDWANLVMDAVACQEVVVDVISDLINDFLAKGIDINAIFAESPIYILVTNTSNQRAGFLDDGSIVNEIADSEALQAGDGRKLVLYPGRDTKTITVTGSGDGHFDLTLAIGKADGSTHNVRYHNITVFTDTVGTIDAADSTYSLVIDDNGDGVIDRVELPSSTTIIWPGTAYLPVIFKH